MPRLIDPSTLERPVPRPAGGIARFQPQSATQDVAEATVGLGGTIERIGEELTKARRASQLSEAVSLATGDLNELELSFQRDQDFKTAPTRFAKSAEEIQRRFEETIDDRLVRETFRRRFRDLSQAKHLNVMQLAAKREGDHNAAALDSALDVYAHSAANAVNPAELEVVINQARLSITEMQSAGWITAVDAGNRERAFLGKVAQATVMQDMAVNPLTTSERLSIDPTYAAALDPVARERWIDHGLRRSEAELRRSESEAEKIRKQRGDEYMKLGFEAMNTGTLTRDLVDQARPWVSPTEYQSLLKGLDGGPDHDDRTAFSDLQRLVDTNPQRAEALAFQYHRNGLIRNETLSSVVNRARAVSRQEGPRSAYERERLFITNALKPSDFVMDPAASARYALVIREFDDYAEGGQRTDQELRAKADELLKHYALVDMLELARQTRSSIQPTPQDQLESIRLESERLITEKDAGRITPEEFNKRMAELKKARDAALRAQGDGKR